MAVREGFHIDSPRSQDEQVRKEDGGVALKALDKRAIGIKGCIAGAGNIHGDGVAIAQVGERDHKRAIDQLTDQVSVRIGKAFEILVVFHGGGVDIEAAWATDNEWL